MYTNQEYENFERIGVEPHRSYYIPFTETEKIKNKFGIVDRSASSRFVSLDGIWQIKQHRCLEEVLTESIPVPACVQMHGYDSIQYVVYRRNGRRRRDISWFFTRNIKNTQHFLVLPKKKK